jgi:hypothetical protein
MAKCVTAGAALAMAPMGYRPKEEVAAVTEERTIYLLIKVDNTQE